MTNLKAELNEYLARNDKTTGKSNGMSASISMPEFGKFTKMFSSKRGADESCEDLLTETPTRRFYDDLCPSLTFLQRVVGFCICFGMSVFFFGASTFFIPVLFVKARKFALLYTMGSCLFFSSFLFLLGPTTFCNNVFSVNRAGFTFSYVGTLLATLYFALWLKSTPFTVLCAMLQFVTLGWFLITYLPYGSRSSFPIFGRLFASSISRTLPV